MAIKSQPMAIVPEGPGQGIVTACEQGTTTFDPHKGPEEVVRITVQPKGEDESGLPYMAVSLVYAPSLNGVSGLSGLLNRFGIHPPAGEAWEPASFIGTELTFVAVHKDNGFVALPKDSLRPL